MLCQADTSCGTHFIGTSEIGAVGNPFGQRHDKYIHYKQDKNSPEPLSAQRHSAAIESTEYHVDCFDRQAEWDNIYQVGKHRVAHRFAKAFGVPYRNIFYCIHSFTSFLLFSSQRNASV